MTECEILAGLASRFALPGRLSGIRPLGDGLINETWLVSTDQSQGVLQRINKSVFPRPEWNMANLRRVVGHLMGKPDKALHLPIPIPSLSGPDWIEQDGEFWRMLEFINGVTLKQLDTSERATRLGWSLGHLHHLLVDLDPAGFHDTLPGFHVTTGYLNELDRALAGCQHPSDPDLESALTFIALHRNRAAVLEKPELPIRIVHGDPKLDNVVFDPDTRQPWAWVDLDTLKPGSVLYDIGDCVRSSCGSGGRFDLEKAISLLSGWFSQARHFLVDEEVARVPDALWLLPFELGVRFVTDYLAGDRYFKVSHPRENLSRALDQFALAREIGRQEACLTQRWRVISARPGR